MKRIVMILLCGILCVGLSSCEKSSGNSNSNYNDRYAAGYAAGIEDLGRFAEVVFDDVGSNLHSERGMYPDEALQILTNYADGEPVSQRDVDDAIWALQKYYNDLTKAMHNLAEDYIP